MKAKWRKIAVGVTIVVLSVSVLVWWGSREPIYRGKPLSYWLDETKGGDTEQAQAALRSVGRAAVRFLLDQVAREHPARQRIYALMWPKLPLGLRQRLSPPVSFRNYGNPNSRVVGYLRVLDPQTAMPDLLKALGSSDSGLQITALAAIAEYGEQADAALPSLVTLMKHPNGFVRRWAVFAVGRMGASRKQRIPVLIWALKDDETSPLPGSPARVRETAARVLGEIGPEAEAASQELKKLVSDSNSGVRTEAAIALWRIDEDRDALPVLISELEKTDAYEDRKTIIKALGEMGPLAKPALPAIRNVIDPQQRRGVVWGRMIVLPTPPRRRTSYVPTLEEIANEALHRIDPQKQGGVPDRLFDEAPGLLR